MSDLSSTETTTIQSDQRGAYVEVTITKKAYNIWK